MNSSQKHNKNSQNSKQPSASSQDRLADLLDRLEAQLHPSNPASQATSPPKDRPRRPRQLLSLLLPLDLHGNPRRQEALATFRQLANNTGIAEHLLAGESSLLGGWKQAIDSELRDFDSEYDKAMLAMAYTVIDTVCSTIAELGVMPKE